MSAALEALAKELEVCPSSLMNTLAILVLDPDNIGGRLEGSAARHIGVRSRTTRTYDSAEGIRRTLLIISLSGWHYVP